MSTRRSRRSVSLLMLAGALAGWTGCGRENERVAPRQRLVVFAAASLRECFEALAPELERAQAEVELHFAGTQELRMQLEHGAQADVFASADERQMQALVGSGQVEQPIVFAHNQLVLVVAREQVKTIRELADLPKAERIVLGAPEVPIGRYTSALLDRAATRLGPDFRARVEANVVSRELNVRQVLTKLRLGEATAGIVYRSDVAAVPSELGVVRLPAELDAVARYPIAVVRRTKVDGLARAWVELVLGERGRDALARAGFSLPRAEASP